MTMPHYESIVRRAVAAASIRRDALYWFGSRYCPWPVVQDDAMVDSARRALIARCLYLNFFTVGGARPPQPPLPTLPAHSTELLRTRLERCALGSSSEEGWREAGLDERGQVLAVRDGLEVTVRSSQIMARSGDTLTLRVRRVLPGRSPGFVSYRPGHAHEGLSAPIVRLYWNVPAWLAPVLAADLCRNLDRLEVPYGLKVAADPMSYGRADAAVLYVAAADLPASADVIARAHRRVAPSMAKATPAMTLRVGGGLGLALDPATGESFGTFWCSILATAMDEAVRSDLTPGQRPSAVLRQLVAGGLSIERPYLAGQSPPSAAIDSIAIALASDAARPRRRNRDRPLDVAVRIGRRIESEAIWAAERCTWVEAETSDRRGRPAIGALGADVYGGTSGIAVFFAELERATGGGDFERVAVAAARHALDAASAELVPSGGLYLGSLGVALAVRRVAEVLERSDLAQASIRLASSASDELPLENLGVVAGGAGNVLALLALARSDGAQHLVARGTAAAHGLAHACNKTDQRALLTGYAHGASGIACALMQAAALGDPSGELVEAASRLFDTEDQAFSLDEGNWRDRRFPARSPVYSVAWCHGAGGIALARSRAPGKPGLETAMTTVVDHLQRRESGGLETVTLCHGYPGLIEIAQLVTDRCPALARALPSYAGWPLVVDCVESMDAGRWKAGLMVGAAGLGMMALRATDPQIPSPLSMGLSD